MRVLIEPQLEDARQRKLWLGPNQQVRVGGTAWAEFSVADPQLSDIHFILETNQDNCFVRETPGGRGLFVNGVRVHEAILRHGDDLFAGSTHFRVALENAGTGSDVMATRRSGLHANKRTDPARKSDPAPNHRPVSTQRTVESRTDRRFAGRMTRSGLACFRQLRLAPSEVATRLARTAAPFLILNAGRIEFQVAAPLGEPIGLVAPDRSASGAPFSLGFYPLTSSQQMAVLDSVWGLDAAIVGFSRQPEQQLISAIRNEVNWFVSPSLLRTQLDQADRRFVGSLIGLFDAVLLETEERDWLVYSRPDSSSPWVCAGFPANIQV